MMKVKAIKPGFFGKLREPGDEFDVPDDAEATWFKPVEPVVPAAKVKEPAKAPTNR